MTVHKAGEKGQGCIYASKPSRIWVAPWLPALTAGIMRALMCLPGMVKAVLDASQAEFKGHQTQQAQSDAVSRCLTWHRHSQLGGRIEGSMAKAPIRFSAARARHQGKCYVGLPWCPNTLSRHFTGTGFVPLPTKRWCTGASSVTSIPMCCTGCSWSDWEGTGCILPTWTCRQGEKHHGG